MALERGLRNTKWGRSSPVWRNWIQRNWIIFSFSKFWKEFERFFHICEMRIFAIERNIFIFLWYDLCELYQAPLTKGFLHYLVIRKKGSQVWHTSSISLFSCWKWRHLCARPARQWASISSLLFHTRTHLHGIQRLPLESKKPFCSKRPWPWLQYLLVDRPLFKGNTRNWARWVMDMARDKYAPISFPKETYLRDISSKSARKVQDHSEPFKFFGFFP